MTAKKEYEIRFWQNATFKAKLLKTLELYELGEALKGRQTSMRTALIELCSFFAKEQLEYCLIGGFAISIRGMPCFTPQLELLVTPALLEYQEKFEKRFAAELLLKRKCSPVPAQLQLEILNVETLFTVAKTPLELRALANAESIEALGCELSIVGAEDLILLELTTGEMRSLAEIGSVIQVSKLDYDYLLAQIETNGLESPWETSKAWAQI